MSRKRQIGRGWAAGAMLAGLLAGAACTIQPQVRVNPVEPGTRGGVVLLAPRCADASSCVVGHVTAAESGSPLSHAAVFLQLEAKEAKSDPRWILALTDEQGVFEIDDPPPGRYRLSVYAPPREIEMGGIQLGERGTTVVPVRLPPS